MRKTKLVTIAAEGRDKGKTFLIREMSAMQAEKWAAKALLALGKSGADVSDEVMQAGAAALISAGLAAFRQIDFSDAEPLLDEMMSCISRVPDTGKINEATGEAYARDLIGDDIEEVATLLFLRAEVFEVHAGFSVTAVLSTLGAAVKAGSRPTPTSRKPSARSSGTARPRSTNAKPSMA